MKKGIVIGIIVVIIIAAIIVVSSSLNLESYDDSSIDNAVEDESIPIEEIVSESETTGRNLSVDLTENMGLSSP